MSKSHHTKTGFCNPWLNGKSAIGLRDRIHWKFEALIKNPIVKPETYLIPTIDPVDVNIPSEINSTALTWVGHSTYLIQIDGVNLLTDPVWSLLVGPRNKIGPRRKTAPGIPWEKLPHIDIVLISHSHYDHLDEPTVLRLHRDFDPVFYVPLGVKSILAEWGIDRVHELDWWDNDTIEGLEIICTPAQHTSRRGFFDVDRTLWSGWLVNGTNESVYFAGDTGYFPGFKEIGNNQRPIDIAILPIGGYNPRSFMHPIHLDPREALQAFRELNARYFAAMHWGTFDVTNELLDEPPKVLRTIASELDIDTRYVWLPALGETRVIPESPYR